VLVSGDSDFAYAFQAVKNMGKHVEVAYFENVVSKDLLDIADNRHLLDRGFFSDLWAGKHYAKRRSTVRRAKRPIIPFANKPQQIIDRNIDRDYTPQPIDQSNY
jgi:hypothetical protein